MLLSRQFANQNKMFLDNLPQIKKLSFCEVDDDSIAKHSFNFIFIFIHVYELFLFSVYLIHYIKGDDLSCSVKITICAINSSKRAHCDCFHGQKKTVKSSQSSLIFNMSQ